MGVARLFDSIKSYGLIDGIAFEIEEHNIEKNYKEAIKELEKREEELLVEKYKNEFREKNKNYD